MFVTSEGGGQIFYPYISTLLLVRVSQKAWKDKRVDLYSLSNKQLIVTWESFLENSIFSERMDDIARLLQE
jgi:hypothetical protein